MGISALSGLEVDIAVDKTAVGLLLGIACVIDSMTMSAPMPE